MEKLIVIMLTILVITGGCSACTTDPTVEDSTVPTIQYENTVPDENSVVHEKTLPDTSGAKNCVGIGEELICDGQVLVVE